MAWRRAHCSTKLSTGSGQPQSKQRMFASRARHSDSKPFHGSSTPPPAVAVPVEVWARESTHPLARKGWWVPKRRADPRGLGARIRNQVVATGGGRELCIQAAVALAVHSLRLKPLTDL